MTPLERAARAIFAADYPQHVDADLEIDEAGMVLYARRHLWYLDAARDVLRAIREPSEAMLEAGWTSDLPHTPSVKVDVVWQAMIDTIFAEKV